jgi:hypothetical protein
VLSGRYGCELHYIGLVSCGCCVWLTSTTCLLRVLQLRFAVAVY